MQRILGLPTCLLGLTAILVLFAACGQNEGGRCQVNSDCGSGLICKEGATGNGTCVPSGSVANQTSDAAASNDLPEDETVPFSPEAGPEAEVVPAVDASSLDAGAVDSDELDSSAID